MDKINIFWFRRDLRLEDNVGLHHALVSGLPVVPIFIFDTDILDMLDDKVDKRVDYIQQALTEIDKSLQKSGARLKTYLGQPLEIFKTLSKNFDIETVFYNTDYEPQAIRRDKEVTSFLSKNKIQVSEYKDQVIFEKDEIVKSDDSPYTVYTPYSKKWKEHLTPIKTFSTKHIGFAKDQSKKTILTLKDIGFEKTELTFKPPVLKKSIIDDYHLYRDIPALDHTTHLGIALRFGTISIRQCVKFALKHNETWLNELIWREFFMQILYHFPYVATQCFKKKYEAIPWLNNEKKL